jgi:hypothetical protein
MGCFAVEHALATSVIGGVEPAPELLEVPVRGLWCKFKSGPNGALISLQEKSYSSSHGQSDSPEIRHGGCWSAPLTDGEWCFFDLLGQFNAAAHNSGCPEALSAQPGA